MAEELELFGFADALAEVAVEVDAFADALEEADALADALWLSAGAWRWSYKLQDRRSRRGSGTEQP